MKAAWSRYKPFLKRVVDLGAIEAKVIQPSTVVTADWRTLDGYQAAILAHFGAEGHVTNSMTTLEREVFLQGYQKALALGAGPCNLCRSCPEEGCKHADKARPSMEACGIDVFPTARNNGYPIEVVVDESSEQNYYRLLLIE